MKRKTTIAAAAVAITASLGTFGFGSGAIAEAQPGTFPTDQWCPGAYWNPFWGSNWDWNHCHDSFNPGGGHGPFGPGGGGGNGGGGHRGGGNGGGGHGGGGH
ncbi:hypothetical protein Mkiyose1665_51210 [Mycobacterium kiyosense]|uniref:Pilin n=1 Tax=Mycobacterium kiyosense TaxID=2871094 RepID=A0AA37Q7Q1_9MYCO|nr:hypothetical protein MKCMC460_59410 [Mycobacterium sp. 20KCMC460]GLB85269.1 hypothetical protein SRL2020028_45250 [Mycobacterium kiyosense]GLB92548.1 hypothetical protein SRL2020130_53650 [Mycobacterium kiyosense]GLB98313.1 hypothetical protein SRL2020226_50890 [Mycobacterium kiyosense]GLC05051.1 hypothetical protein SRL2020400_56420 [Mycobacterium kiyosense]